MRFTHPGLPLATALLFIASCAQKPPSDPAPSEVQAIAVDPAIKGVWQPYDTAANATLGTIDVQDDRLVFGKGPTLRITPVSSRLVRVQPADGAAPISGRDTLCGADPVLSVSFQLTQTAPGKVLRVSVHDVATGPGSDPDFDPHRCQVFTYVRD